MDRYQKIDQIISKADPEHLKECPSKSGCSCRGCFSSLKITKSDYEKWIKRHKEQSEKLPPFTLGTIRQYTDKTQGWEKVSFDELMKGLKSIFK